jgi:hypothetical protein
MLPFGRETDMTAKGGTLWSGAGLWALLVFLVCLACGGLLFGVYGHYFPTIGGFRDDWNVFGALIGGFGSCIGAVATLATLLFLAHQNHKQQGFIDWQLYVAHKQSFFDRLTGLQKLHDDSFRFRDPETLYAALFPANGPSNVDFVVRPDYHELTGNYLGSLSRRLEALDDTLKVGRCDVDKRPRLVEDLLCLAESLGYKWLNDHENGDILLLDKNYGVNIYWLKEFVDRAASIHNAFLVFTGNSASEGFRQDNCGWPREDLMRYFLNRWSPKHGTVAVKLSSTVKLFEKVYLAADLRTASKMRIMNLTYLSLSGFLKSRVGLKNLDDPATLASLTHIALEELTNAFEGNYIPEDRRQDLSVIRSELVALRARQ